MTIEAFIVYENEDHHHLVAARSPDQAREIASAHRFIASTESMRVDQKGTEWARETTVRGEDESGGRLVIDYLRDARESGRAAYIGGCSDV